MATKKGRLSFDLQVMIEKRDGYFAAVTKPLAITVYGNTLEEAEQRAEKAVWLLLAQHSTTPEQMIDFLKRKNWKYILYAKGEEGQHAPIIRECTQLIEVPVG